MICENRLSAYFHQHILDPVTTSKTAAARKSKLSVASETSAAEAVEQAEEYDSIFAPMPLELDNGEILMIPPHPDYGMLDDDSLEAYDELKFRVDTEYEREPDTYVPEQTVEDNGQTLTIPAETIRGALRIPYRIRDENGRVQLVKPPHQIQVVRIALGAEGFARLKAGGKNASDVFALWSKRSIEIRNRALRDSKSAGVPVDLAAVPEATDQ